MGLISRGSRKLPCVIPVTRLYPTPISADALTERLQLHEPPGLKVKARKWSACDKRSILSYLRLVWYHFKQEHLALKFRWSSHMPNWGNTYIYLSILKQVCIIKLHYRTLKKNCNILGKKTLSVSICDWRALVNTTTSLYSSPCFEDFKVNLTFKYDSFLKRWNKIMGCARGERATREIGFLPVRKCPTRGAELANSWISNFPDLYSIIRSLHRNRWSREG